LPPPCVEAIRGEAHRHVSDEADLTGRACHLAIEVKLLPHVEGDAAAEAAALCVNACAFWMAQLGGPAPPCRAVLLGKGVVRGEVAERLALAMRPRPQPGRVGGHFEDRFEGLELQAEDLVVIDEPDVIQLLGGRAQRLELGGDLLGALDLLDADVDRVAEATRRGVVRRCFVRKDWRLRAERVDEEDLGALLSRPLCEAAKVGHVANAPAVTRAR